MGWNYLIHVLCVSCLQPLGGSSLTKIFLSTTEVSVGKIYASQAEYILESTLYSKILKLTYSVSTFLTSLLDFFCLFSIQSSRNGVHFRSIFFSQLPGSEKIPNILLDTEFSNLLEVFAFLSPGLLPWQLTGKHLEYIMLDVKTHWIKMCFSQDLRCLVC